MSSPRDFDRRQRRLLAARRAHHQAARARRASKACAGPAGWRPRRSTSSRRTSCRASATGELDKLCHDFILDHKAIPAPLNYRGFPKSICTSINHVVCHGIPGDKRLQNGDIVNIDVTVILDGWYGDTSRMFYAGDVGVKARRLCDVTYEAMMRGIAAAKPGGRVGDIGHAIQSYVEAQRFSVVRDFSGHGLGRIFHDAPNILHYGKAGTGPVLKPGMFFTVEPMVNVGTWQVKILSDGWTAVTRDKQLSAQFEHSVGITETGRRVLHAVAQGAGQAALRLSASARPEAASAGLRLVPRPRPFAATISRRSVPAGCAGGMGRRKTRRERGRPIPTARRRRPCWPCCWPPACAFRSTRCDLWRVTGNTLPHRTLLRDAGGDWNRLDQCWEFAATIRRRSSPPPSPRRRLRCRPQQRRGRQRPSRTIGAIASGCASAC